MGADERKPKPSPKVPPSVDADMRLAATDEILQVMYWLRGEKIAQEVAPDDLAKKHLHAHQHGDYVHNHAHGHDRVSHGHSDDAVPPAKLDRRFGSLNFTGRFSLSSSARCTVWPDRLRSRCLFCRSSTTQAGRWYIS